MKPSSTLSRGIDFNLRTRARETNSPARAIKITLPYFLAPSPRKHVEEGGHIDY